MHCKPLVNISFIPLSHSTDRLRIWETMQNGMNWASYFVVDNSKVVVLDFVIINTRTGTSMKQLRRKLCWKVCLIKYILELVDSQFRGWTQPLLPSQRCERTVFSCFARASLCACCTASHMDWPALALSLRRRTASGIVQLGTSLLIFSLQRKAIASVSRSCTVSLGRGCYTAPLVVPRRARAPWPGLRRYDWN